MLFCMTGVKLRVTYLCAYTAAAAAAIALKKLLRRDALKYTTNLSVRTGTAQRVRYMQRRLKIF